MLHTVARHPVFIINEPKLLFRCLAFLHCHLTASVEGTSAGRIDGTWDIAFEHVETLAMAFSETRQFEKAIEVQQGMIQEVSRSGRKDLVALLQENLSRYQQGQACRQPWRDDDPVFSPVPGELTPLGSAAEPGS